MPRKPRVELTTVTTVGQLRALLHGIPDDTLIVTTWEGTVQYPEYYRAHGGTVVLDADGGFYRDAIMKASRETKEPLYWELY